VRSYRQKAVAGFHLQVLPRGAGRRPGPLLAHLARACCARRSEAIGVAPPVSRRQASRAAVRATFEFPYRSGSQLRVLIVLRRPGMGESKRLRSLLLRRPRGAGRRRPPGRRHRAATGTDLDSGPPLRRPGAARGCCAVVAAQRIRVRAAQLARGSRDRGAGGVRRPLSPPTRSWASSRATRATVAFVEQSGIGPVICPSRVDARGGTRAQGVQLHFTERTSETPPKRCVA